MKIVGWSQILRSFVVFYVQNNCIWIFPFNFFKTWYTNICPSEFPCHLENSYVDEGPIRAEHLNIRLTEFTSQYGKFSISIFQARPKNLHLFVSNHVATEPWLCELCYLRGSGLFHFLTCNLKIKGRFTVSFFEGTSLLLVQSFGNYRDHRVLQSAVFFKIIRTWLVKPWMGWQCRLLILKSLQPSSST